MLAAPLAETRAAPGAVRAALPYVAPLAVFMALGALEGPWPEAYPVLYAIKVLAVGTLLLVLGRGLAWRRPAAAHAGLACLLGAALCVVWVALDKVTPHLAVLGSRQAYDPFGALPDPAGQWAFVAVRLIGLAIVVPLVEELFFQGFMLRFLTNPDAFHEVPVGSFSRFAVAGTAALFAVGHPEWLSAVVFALAVAWLLRRTQNLLVAVLCHATANACLGLYILATRSWQYW